MLSNLNFIFLTRSINHRIKHKQFNNFKSWTMDLCGRPLTIEVGKVAELASASAMVKYGDTTVMVAVTVSPVPGTASTSSPVCGV